MDKREFQWFERHGAAIAFWLLVIYLIFTFAGCASLQDIANVLTGNSAQKATKTPITIYQPDLRMTVDGAAFTGMGVTRLTGPKDITIESLVKVNRIEISTCARHDVCQIKGGELACDQSRFQIDRGWFGAVGKRAVYQFAPTAEELTDSCGHMLIQIYDQNSLAAWGYLAFRVNADFPAHFSCNAKEWSFAGISVCATKAGTIELIRFDQPPDDFEAEDSCHMIKQSPTAFEIRPVAWCRASFMKDGRFHDVVTDGYDEVLIRGE